MVQELTVDRLQEFIMDEENAVKEYRKYGLYEIADDEKRHFEALKIMQAMKMKEKLSKAGIIP